MLALAAARVAAQPVALSEYRQHLQRGVDTAVYEQVAAGWLDGATRQTWYFGRTAKPDLASAFEVGAATEIFTGLLLAQAAYEGKVRLQAPIREVLPKDFVLADSALGTVTLQELATHRAGLPTAPPNLLPANVDDPYADYSARDLRALLANFRRAGETARSTYSTLDAGLLGNLLSQLYAQPYTELLRDKILTPLGMQNSGFDDSLGLLAGHVHDAAAAHWHFGALAGAAGLRSSVGDLLTFLQQNLQPQNSPLRAALLLARQAQSGTKQDVGLGWNIVEVEDGEQVWPLVWRASRTAGFATFLGFRTDRQQALVLLGNNDADLSALGIAWLEQRPPPPLPDPAPPAPTSLPLADYPGLYQVGAGTEFIVRTHANGLAAQISGQAAQPLHALAADTFAGETLALVFQRQLGKVTSAVLDVGGLHVQARRLSDHAPIIVHIPIAPDAKAIAEAAGDYMLDAATLLRVRAGADAITLQMTGRAPMPLIAFAKDRYADAEGTCELRLQRDDKDAVSGLLLNLGGSDRAAPRINWVSPM